MRLIPNLKVKHLVSFDILYLKLSTKWHQVLEMEANEAASNESDLVDQSPIAWHLGFEEQRKQIIMLWHLCHVSIIHRTQFYMLFKGDPADQIYIEVELRRLTWLEQHLAALGNASPALLSDEAAGSVVSRYSFNCLCYCIGVAVFDFCDSANRLN